MLILLSPLAKAGKLGLLDHCDEPAKAPDDEAAEEEDAPGDAFCFCDLFRREEGIIPNADAKVGVNRLAVKFE